MSTYNNILTSGLQSLWLVRLLGGHLTLPSTDSMAKDVRDQQR